MLHREAIKATDREQLAVEVDSTLAEVLTTIGEQLSGQRKADIQALIHELSVKDAELSAKDAQIEAASQEAARQAALASEASEAERIRKQQEEEEKKREEQAKKLDAAKTAQLQYNLGRKSLQLAVAIGFAISAVAFAFHFALEWPDHLLTVWALPCLAVVTVFLWKTQPALGRLLTLIVAIVLVAPLWLPRLLDFYLSPDAEQLWTRRISLLLQGGTFVVVLWTARRASP